MGSVFGSVCFLILTIKDKRRFRKKQECSLCSGKQPEQKAEDKLGIEESSIIAK